MLRKFVLGTGVLALGLGLASGGGAGIAGATKTPTQLSGDVTCTAAGAVKFSPKLTNDGSSAETLTVKIKFTGCSGPGASEGGVTLTGGTVKATTSATFSTNCGAVFNDFQLPAVSGQVKWKGSGGPIATSEVTIPVEALIFNSGDDTLAVYLGTPENLTSVTSGSFDGQHLSFADFTVKKNPYKTTASCEGNGIGGVSVSGGTASLGA